MNGRVGYITDVPGVIPHPLPPFDGMNTCCPKCGRLNGERVRYMSSWRVLNNMTSVHTHTQTVEWLELTCADCGYQRFTATADAGGAA